MNISPREILLFEINLTVYVGKGYGESERAIGRRYLLPSLDTLAPNPDNVFELLVSHKTISPFISFLTSSLDKKLLFSSSDASSYRLKIISTFKRKRIFPQKKLSGSFFRSLGLNLSCLQFTRLNFITFSYFFPVAS